MLESTAPAGLPGVRRDAVTALWRGLVRVVNASPVTRDPSRALLEPVAGAGHTVRALRVPIGDHETPGRLFLPSNPTGASVVLAHGTTAEGPVSYFMWIRALLDQGIAVMTFDLDGHGENPRALRSTEIDQNMPAAIAIARAQSELDPDRIGVMGVSLGGACAVNVAARDKRVKAAVTISAPHRIQIDDWGKLGEAMGLFNPEVASMLTEVTPNVMLAFLNNHVRVTPEDGAERGDLLAPGTRQAVHRSLRQLNPLDAAAELGHSPLLVINGEWDFVSPPWQARDLFERAACEKSLLVVPRRNHFTVMVSRPAVTAMAAWFQRWL